MTPTSAAAPARSHPRRASRAEHSKTPMASIFTEKVQITYATALVNAGCSLQALMALLGHVSAQMSLRYARLFDHTVRTEYERALDLTKSHLGPLPAGRLGLSIEPAGTDWRDSPTIKARLAGGYCLRAPAPGGLPLRQHLRTLPQLPNRRQPPRRPRRPARRRPSPRRRRRRPRLGR